MRHDDATRALRARLEQEIRAGKTVALSQAELDDPTLRAQLPELLDELTRGAGGGPEGALRIPGHTLLGVVGQGGMSTVYLARQDALGRHVAIKVAPNWLGGDRGARHMLQEAQAMARLVHPNVVSVYDVLEVGNSIAIAMEWVDGSTLASLLRALPSERTPQDMRTLRDTLGAPAEAAANFEAEPVRHFVRLVEAVARATQTVHEAGFLHLDIKPSNVLVRRDGTPLLADFGVVRAITPDLVQTRTLAGTPLYSAPEQLRGEASRVGPATDVYGLGMTLYETLARSKPLDEPSLDRILARVEAGGPPRLSTRVDVSADLENIVHKAIDPDPTRRYATAKEFADDLRAFLEHRPVVARPLTRAERVRRWVRNEPWKAGLAAALALLVPSLLGLGTYLLLQLPELLRIEQQLRLAAANALKQEAFQHSITNDATPERIAALLAEAMALDPGDGTLACRAVLLNERHHDMAAAELAKHPDRVERSAALHLFQQKAVHQRSFFDAAEVAMLKGSDDPLDRYVLALERTFWANDAAYDEAWSEAQTCIQAALLETGPDPLLYGTLAWTSYRAGDRRTLDAASAALRRHWPDDPVALCWRVIAVEELEPDLARRLAEQAISAAPGHPRGYELRASIERRVALKRRENVGRRNDDFDDTMAQLRRAADAGVDSHGLRSLAQMLEFDTKHRRFDRASLAAGHAPPTLRAQLRAATEDDRALALEIAESILTTTPPSSHDIASVHALAFGMENRDLEERAWNRYREQFPDRRSQHHVRAWRLAKEREFAAGADLAAETDFPARVIDEYALFEVRAHIAHRRWAQLQRDAERWVRVGSGSERQQAAFYAGLAAARLGDTTTAAERLAVAVSRSAQKVWYSMALLETAALLASPASPSELRDARLAAHRIEEFERNNQRNKVPQAGPWTDLVRAEVAFASGDRDKAIALAERAMRYRRPEQHAPDDCQALVQEALERFRK